MGFTYQQTFAASDVPPAKGADAITTDQNVRILPPTDGIDNALMLGKGSYTLAALRIPYEHFAMFAAPSA